MISVQSLLIQLACWWCLYRAAEEHTAAWAMAGVARVSAAARGMMSMRGDEVTEHDVAAACGLCSMQNESDVDACAAVVDGRRRGRPPKLRDKE